MNLRAKCVNPKCPQNGVEYSVPVAQISGFGAPNDRAICPVCHELMRTTKSINVSSGKGTGKRSVGRRVSTRSPISRTGPSFGTKKRTKKRVTKRGISKRA